MFRFQLSRRLFLLISHFIWFEILKHFFTTMYNLLEIRQPKNRTCISVIDLKKNVDFRFNRSFVRIYLMLLSGYVDKKASLGVDSFYKSHWLRRIYKINTGWIKKRCYLALVSSRRWNCGGFSNIEEFWEILSFLFIKKSVLKNCIAFDIGAKVHMIWPTLYEIRWKKQYNKITIAFDPLDKSPSNPTRKSNCLLRARYFSLFSIFFRWSLCPLKW